MIKRERNLVVRCSDEELSMLHRIAGDTDESIARIVRRLVATAYVEKYGVTRPPRARLKHAAKR